MEDMRLLMEEGGKAAEKAQKDAFTALIKLLDKADHEVFEELERRHPEMAEAWMEMIAPEMKERDDEELV